MIVRLPSLLSASDVAAVVEQLAPAAWRDGKRSAQGKAREAKQNLVVPSDDPASSAAGLIILERVSRSDAFRAASQPRTVLPFVFCRYDEGMAYGAHLDLPMMGSGAGAIRTDISMTLFLCSPESYSGGELVLDSEYGEQTIRGELGEAVLYPSSLLHRVEPVSRGSRVVAVTWIQSLLREPYQRRIVANLSRVANVLDQSASQHDEALLLRQTQYELLRLWGD